jgi:hypothetical protein
MEQRQRKKNQLVGSVSGHDLDIKKIIHILEEYHETVNGEYPLKDLDVKITIRERK